MVGIKVKFVDSDKDFKLLLTRFNDMRKIKLQVGFPTKAKVKKGSNKGSGRKPWTSMHEAGKIAWYNEYGVRSKNIPARPFIRPAFDENLNEVTRIMEQGIDDVLHKKGYRLTLPLQKAGSLLVKKMREKIVSMTSPALKSATINKKGHSKLLIDSKQMYNSITYILENK